MPRNAKQFVAPSLNLFRVKDSKSTYARTKVPAYLVAADPDLKRMFNWGKITDETRPEIEANHERLVCRLMLVQLLANLRCQASIPGAELSTMRTAETLRERLGE